MSVIYVELTKPDQKQAPLQSIKEANAIVLFLNYMICASREYGPDEDVDEDLMYVFDSIVTVRPRRARRFVLVMKFMSQRVCDGHHTSVVTFNNILSPTNIRLRQFRRLIALRGRVFVDISAENKLLYDDVNGCYNSFYRDALATTPLKTTSSFRKAEDYNSDLVKLLRTTSAFENCVGPQEPKRAQEYKLPDATAIRCHQRIAASSQFESDEPLVSPIVVQEQFDSVLLNDAATIDAAGCTEFCLFFQSCDVKLYNNYVQMCINKNVADNFFANPLLFIVANEPLCCFRIAKRFLIERRARLSTID